VVARAVIADRTGTGGGLCLVELTIDREAARTYENPGQYVEIKTERGNGYFVLAGDVTAGTGGDRWALLVRNAGDAADVLVNAPLGTAVEISGALGDGFPIGGSAGKPLAVVVVGTAMAAARPILHRRIADGDAQATYVFLGVRSPVDVPLAHEIDGWAYHGAHVVLCLSKESENDEPAVLPHARRAIGYVQREVSRAVAAGELPRGTLVVAAGPKGMLGDMRAIAEAHIGAVEVVTNV
jgi:NAD(P)H-flavin reductase